MSLIQQRAIFKLEKNVFVSFQCRQTEVHGKNYKDEHDSLFLIFHIQRSEHDEQRLQDQLRLLYMANVWHDNV